MRENAINKKLKILKKKFNKNLFEKGKEICCLKDHSKKLFSKTKK